MVMLLMLLPLVLVAGVAEPAACVGMWMLAFKTDYKYMQCNMRPSISLIRVKTAHLSSGWISGQHDWLI